jgi:hypothetical protein
VIPDPIEIVARGIGNDDVRHRARSKLSAEARSRAAQKLVEGFQRPVTPGGARLARLVEKALDIIVPVSQNIVKFRSRVVVECASYRAFLDICAH